MFIEKGTHARQKERKSWLYKRIFTVREIQHRKWEDNHRKTTTCAFKMQSPGDEKAKRANDTIMPFTLASCAFGFAPYSFFFFKL